MNVSLWRSIDDLGPVDDPRREPGPGIPQAIADLVRIVPFNDLAAVEQVFARAPRRDRRHDHRADDDERRHHPARSPATSRVSARSLARNGALLAFDEVKTGLVVAWGGATELFGVTPDIICLAKALGGGVPCGAIGGTDEVMAAISDGRYDQVGTFNGNPLTMAAARAVLTEVLTPDVVRPRRGARPADVRRVQRCAARARACRRTAWCTGSRARWSCTTSRPRNYREFLAIDTAISHLNYLVQHNNGVFLAPWAKSESWTLSVAHTSSDGERVVDNMARLARMLDRAGDETSELFEVGGVT